MIRKVLQSVLAPRHPWRKVGFSELSEMYLAVFLRTFALTMVGIFVPIYLLTNGYTFTYVLLFYALFYTFGIVIDVLGAYAVARFGPKHVMRLSFLLQMIFSLMLVNLNHLTAAIPLLALVSCFASTFYFLPYHVDFSKIKHKDHGGKELGFLQIMERVASITGPIIGGLLAVFVSPQATFWAAALAMLVATIILMLSPEPVQTHQRIRFKGLKIKIEMRSYASCAALCVENGAAIWLWPVYLSAVVFSGSAYLKIGGIASLSVFIAVVVALPLGRLLDKQGGKLMIKYGTLFNSLVHLSRLFVHGVPGAVAVAGANEPITLVYKMAFLKGYYDAADDHPGYRIAYITAHEIASDIARSLFWFVLVGLSLFTTAYVVCAVGFIIAAICSMLIRLQDFPGLQ